MFGLSEEIIRYLIVGVLTTLVNFFVHFICRRALKFNMNLSMVVAWFFSVLFAFVTNKFIVFQNYNTEFLSLLKETLLFFGARVASLGVEVVMMNLLVEKMKLKESYAKIGTQFFIVVINYVFSKVIIFKK